MPENKQFHDEALKIRLHVISPVHIGCDEVYEPTSFVINQQKKCLVSFDSKKFVEELSDAERKRFVDVCMKDNILEVYKFIAGNAQRIKGREISVAPGLMAAFESSQS